MKKNKQKYVDDFHTVYSMDNDKIKNFGSKNKEKVSLTTREKNAAINAALRHYFPILIAVILCFSIAMILIYFWLR